MVAFLAHMNPAPKDAVTVQKGRWLMSKVHAQFPGMLQKMISSSAVEARAAAKRLRMTPAPGQTYQQLGIVNVTDEMHACVAALALKLSKAVYWMNSKLVFPNDGALQFQWFTNAQRQEHGRIVVLEALAQLAAMEPEIRRTGRDLIDQFDYRYSVGEGGRLHVLQVVFSTVFGFVTVFSPEAGFLEAMEARIREAAGEGESPLEFLMGGGVKWHKVAARVSSTPSSAPQPLGN